MPITLATDLALEAGFALVKFDRMTTVEAEQGIVLNQSIKAGEPYNPDDLLALQLDIGKYEPEAEPTPAPTPTAEPTPGGGGTENGAGNGNGAEGNGNGNGGSGNGNESNS
jgi:beta-lactam-binding protein with PASTA domain